MPTWETLDLGTFRGRCGSCHQVADLHLHESGYRRTWSELLRDDIDERRDRRVTCSACRRTYPVRSGDSTAAVVERRAEGPRGRRATDTG